MCICVGIYIYNILKISPFHVTPKIVKTFHTYIFNSSYYLPGTVTRDLHILVHLILPTTLR